MKKLHIVVCILLSQIFFSACCNDAGRKEFSSRFDMKGIVLTVNDLENVDWAALAHESGINTIGTHIRPQQVADFMATEKGRKFLDDCNRYGIHVEHQLHAVSELLPRDLFEKDSTMFRMDRKGRRRNDVNLCVHSEAALDTVAARALHYARLLPATNHRYYFWIDDNRPMCQCPECSKYSDSEQALILENRIIKELRTFDPEAQLAHLAYVNTLPAPRQVQPEEGIFLEFAPIYRSWDKPLKEEQIGDAAIEKNPAKQTNLYYLKENLEVFPAETTVVLEYWLDVSLFSNWKKPAVKLPWKRDVYLADLDTYAEYGIRNVTSFAAYIDDRYVQDYADLDFLPEYGEGLNLCYSGPMMNPWGDSCEQTVTSVAVVGNTLRIHFDVTDTDLVYLDTLATERDLEVGDRVEVFFSKDPDMNDYVGFEVDPMGHVLSYRTAYYRKFDYSWEPPQGFSAKASLTEDGYVADVIVPMDFMSGFIKDGKVFMGLYRGDFRKDGDTIIEEWYTWKDSGTSEPDFHVPATLYEVSLF